jgi:Protein of unknown function (DUF2398)
MEAATPATGGRYLVTDGQVRDACASLCERYPAAWAKDDVSILERLASRVTDMLAQVGLARPADGNRVLLSPAASRWAPHAEQKKPSGELSAESGGELFLFEGDPEGYAP